MELPAFLHRLRYFVSDAWDECRRSPGPNALALLTLASTLFLAGLLMLGLVNVERSIEGLYDELQLQVYLAEDVDQGLRGELEREIREMPGVARVEFVDREEALRRYREWASELAGLVEELEAGGLPESFTVVLEPGEQAEERGAAVSMKLHDREGVDEVRFDRLWLRRLESQLRLARVGGALLALLVFTTVVFVMASVLRLAVYARRDEIDVMLLVGATPAFVRGPYLAAALVQGLLASGLALLLVEAVRRAARGWAGSGELALVDVVAARSLPLGVSLLLVGVGLLVSLAGAYFAVRRSL